ncbi:MAG TPA: O-antigen ligase family protein [Solirubrobacteraceae bacterium]|nr:O-antigen ligase family protein [Solirubrobacteraceae bacterium]
MSLRRSSSTQPLMLLGALTAAAAVGALSGLNPKIGVGLAFGLAFAALVLSNVTVALCVLAFLSFLDILPTIEALSLAKIAGLLLAISWLATITSRRDSPSLARDRPWLTVALIGFAAWATLSIVWSPVHGAALTALFRYLPNLLLFPIAYTAIRNRKHVFAVVMMLIAGAALAAVAGVLSPPPNPGAFEPARATGTIGDANELAAALVVGLFLASAVLFDRARPAFVRGACACTAVLCLGGIVLSLSRGGLVALGVAALVAVVVAGRWRAPMLAAAVAICASAVFYFVSVASLPARERVTEVGTGTGRTDLWTVGLRMVSAHPLNGVGVGNFQYASIHYLLQPGLIHRGDFIISTPKIAHNTYLQAFAELGIPGGVLLLLIIATGAGCTLMAARVAARTGELELELLARGVFVGTAGFLAASFFISENYSKLMWILLALGPALLAIARAPNRALPDADTSPP